jgi:hypothetical protein
MRPSFLLRRFRSGAVHIAGLVVLVFAMLYAAWAAHLHRCRTQLNVARHLEERGATIKIDTAGLAWMRALLGEEGFQKVGLVALSGRQFTDDDMAQVEQLRSLDWLTIENTSITDAGLARLHSLTCLDDLELADNEKITDDGLRHLAGLKRLLYLDLTGAQVRGPGLAHLRSLPELHVVNLNNSSVTDKGIERLSHVCSLFDIDLEGCGRVTDAGLRPLANCPNLRSVGLERTHVTDAGLDALARVKTLELVTLDETRVTEAGIHRLQSALPNVEVTVGKKVYKSRSSESEKE